MERAVENWATFQKRIQNFPRETQWLIDYAYQQSKTAHGHMNQTREDGTRYFEHPREVTLIIMDEFKLKEPNLIIGSLLHDTGEDTPNFGNPTKMKYSEWRLQADFLLSKIFNPQVAEIFLAVTKPHVDGLEVRSKKQADHIALFNLSQASAEAKVVKMADRLHNLRSIDAITDSNRKYRKFKETIDDYFPIFNLAADKYPEVTSYAVDEMIKAIGR